MHKPHQDFPIGRNRLEALTVIACACLMSVASAKVIQACLLDLSRGFQDHIYAQIELGVWPVAILVFGTFAKLALYLYCVPLQQYSDSVQALTEDHLNDIMSNSVSMGAALVTVSVKGQEAWWVDPAGGIIISLWIIWRWLDVLREQVYKLVGKNAPAEFVERVSQMVREHHPQMELDVVRVYYFGSRFAVEVEVVLPWNMTLLASHDICLNLQHKIEAFEEVERCHVHADYMKRDEPEHKPEREVGLKRTTSDSGHKPLTQRVPNDYGSC
jgi:divalent metal cation (Fe/Co/Zn/Cd) transporter